jgi:DnaK suppressor protein
MTDARLTDERRVVTERIVSLQAELTAIIEGSRFTTDDDEHDPEGSTIAFERAGIASLLRDAKAELRELDEAQVRVENGTYGICESCGNPIAEPRLDAVPAARYCIDCSRRRSRGR